MGVRIRILANAAGRCVQVLLRNGAVAMLKCSPRKIAEGMRLQKTRPRRGSGGLGLPPLLQ